MNQSPGPVEWKKLRDAYGPAEEVGELLNQIAAGKDAWNDLFSRVLHQDTLYEASAPVAAWFVHAMQSGTIAQRMIPVGKAFGTDEVQSETACALGLLSGMAESARDAVEQTGAHKSSGQTKENYARIGSRVLEALRPGIPIYKRGLDDPDEQVQEFCSILMEVLTEAGD